MRLYKKITLILLFLCCVFGVVKTGYAKWTFSGDANIESNAELTLGDFNFIPVWENEDCLDERTHGYADDLLLAINNMTNPRHAAGQALFRAFWSTNDWYIGNVDLHHNVYLNLRQVLHVTSDCTYIITRNPDWSFDLYVTYVDLNSVHYGDRVGVVYKTHYEFITDKHYITGSCTGTALITTYDSLEWQFQKSINPATFIENN